MPFKPIVKWAGGKTRLLPELLQRVPTHMRVYAEPFAGGAALFFALASERAEGKPGGRTFERAILVDQNEDLIACYRVVKSDVRALIELLATYRYDRELYYEVRERDPKTMTDLERAARLIFLNRTCFNGLWRVNSQGRFNVPFGRYKNPRIVDEEALLGAATALQNVDLRVGDFTLATAELEASDFVYFDPPYAPVSKTADFTTYAVGGFHRADHQRLADELRRLREKGVVALLSNADTEETRELYSDFASYVVQAPRAINSDATKRGAASELIVASWGPPGVFTRHAS